MRQEARNLRRPLRRVFIACLMPLLAGGGIMTPAVRAQADELDFSAWRTLPAFDRGRRMPLESFADVVVREICGRSNPTLDPSDVLEQSAEGSAAREACKRVFPDGKPRRFKASELLFAWMMEPEVWEYIPFLTARHEELRKDLLDVPLRGRHGSRLKHVSPARLIEAEAFRHHLREMSREQSHAMQEGREHSLVGLDRYVNKLYQAYALYRLMTYNPEAEVDIETNRQFGDRLVDVHNLWVEAAPPEELQGARLSPDVEQAYQAVREVFEQLAGRVRSATFNAAEIDPFAVQLRKACERFARLVEEQEGEVSEAANAGAAQRAAAQRRAVKARELVDAAGQLHRSLYDVGRALRLVPGLDPEALRADREQGEQRPPWLSIQAMMLGSDALLAGIPQAELQAVREAYGRLGAVYTDRRNANRTEEFATAMKQFATAVRELGEAVEPLRQKLLVPGSEEDRQRLLAETAYPPVGFNRAELHYNRMQPFLWSWVVCLLATICTAASYAVFRRTLFWVGIGILIVAQLIIAYGLALRTYITGYAAVTNMFESVVFMAYTVALLGVWFALLPLLWPGILAAWRLTAIMPRVRAVFGVFQPKSRAEQCAAVEEDADNAPGEAMSTIAAEQTPATSRAVALSQWLFLVPQVAVMAVLVIALTTLPYGSGGRAIFRLLPAVDPGRMLPTASGLFAWGAGLIVLAITVWLTPRILATALAALVTIPRFWVRGDAASGFEEAYSRRLFVLVGAAVGFLAGVIAYQAPIFDRDIQALQPILRDNFWLTMHVLSITASYGAGALAWGLANISLVYYLFGRYRQVKPNADGVSFRKPPAACHRLAGFIYRVVQVSVLLLTVGTILGALWADVAWGKFWSWDAKEVWSLICILAYMIILHGRYIGWFGDFGLTAGAVLGLTTILMTWYGVNYVFGSGLHSYGGGAGGQYEAMGFVAANWLFLIAAAVRYLGETRRTELRSS